MLQKRITTRGDAPYLTKQINLRSTHQQPARFSPLPGQLFGGTKNDGKRCVTVLTASEVTQAEVASSAAPNAADGPFDWHKQWYCVAVLSSLDPSKPHAMDLLGQHIVLWRDGEGEWRCFLDKCPHRAAPLSEGKIWMDGTLQCSYHGWRFEGEEGNCVRIPQAASEEAEKLACSNKKKACATAFPTKEAQGFVFVWPESGAESAAQAEATPLPICPHQEEAIERGDELTWFMRPFFRDMVQDFSTVVENVVDPAHVPFSHHGVQGNRDKIQYGMYEMQPVKNPENPADVAVSYNMAPFGAATMSFRPPGRVNYLAKQPDGTYSSFLIYVTPTKPGHSRLISSLSTNRKNLPWFLKLVLNKTPTWMEHALTRNKVLDGDAVFLHYQEHFLQEAEQSKGTSWKEEYYLATKADSLVSAFKKWLDGKGGPFGKHLYAAKDYPQLITDHRVLLNRYDQHTRNCKACMKALAVLNKVNAAAAAAAAISWGALACAGVAWLQNRAVAAATTALSTQSMAALGLSSFFFTLVWKMSGDMRQQFYYVPYVHAEK